MMSLIASIDHVVMTVEDIATTVDFYTRVLGVRQETFGNGRVALHLGTQKINLHRSGDKGITDIYAKNPGMGSLDICLLAAVPLEQVIAVLNTHQVPIELGPVKRTGAQGAIRSIYFRDPDNNLIEVSELWKE